jgi:hypothetical protein
MSIICRFCREHDHFTNECKCPKAEELKKEMKHVVSSMLIERYQNIDGVALIDPYNNILFGRMLMLTRPEMIVLTGLDDKYTKKQLIGMYVSEAIENIRTFYSHGSQNNRTMPFRKLHIMFAEISYWDNIAKLTPDNESRRLLEADLIRYVIKKNKTHVFPIKTYLQLYNYDNTEDTWEYAYQLPEFKDATIECAICIEDKPYTKCVSLNCSHKFCGDCFEKILKKCSIEYCNNEVSPSCPLCRANVSYICSPDVNMLDFHIRKYCDSNPYVIKMIVDK